VISAGVLPAAVPVWAVDANASFARPGPRLVDGVEHLAGIIAGMEPPGSAARRLR
jgi:iron complex transport system substrate-binding protein